LTRIESEGKTKDREKKYNRQIEKEKKKQEEKYKKDS
jgi:hypothetical protein